MTGRLLSLSFVLFAAALPAIAEENVLVQTLDAKPPAVTPQEFVATYCLDCHSVDAAEGDREFETLVAAANGKGDTAHAADHAERWQEVLDRLNLGDMPPEDADPQPSDAERLDMITRLTRQLSEASHAGAEPTASLRRLNRAEYDATVRQLLGLEAMLADPTSAFSPDSTVDGFNVVGEALVVSDFLMTRYLEAADAYLAAAIERWQATHRPPEPQSWTFAPPFMREGNVGDGLNEPGQYQHVRENTTDRDGYVWLQKLPRGVPAAGEYVIRVRATGINRDYRYDEAIINVPREDPIVMSIVASDAASDANPQTNHATDRELATFELPDDEPQWFEVRTWLDRGSLLKLGYPNGPHRIKYMRHRLMREHRESFPRFLTECVPVFSTMHPDYDKEEGPKLEAEFLAEQDRLKAAGKPFAAFGIGNLINDDFAWRTFYAEYQGPRVRVFEVELAGPYAPQTPPDSAATPDVIDAIATDAMLEAERLAKLDAFAAAAFRRTPIESERKALHALYRRASETMPPADACRVAFKAVLCSPGTLFHRTQSGELNADELATRLAYFLTAGPPDARLRRLAADGSLTDPDGLHREAERLLDSDARDAFVAAFADAWLQLAKLGTMLPDQVEHPGYFNERLELAMRDETLAFLADAIDRDRPVRWLIDADQAFLNAPLARLYGIDGVDGLALRPVALSEGRRGGLLTQGSVLTASANGIDTSPVVRGMWVLECLLGTPPPPPPPDVEPLEPDIRGAKTIREQLAKHRDVVSCRACHKRIDPLGFALESFDEIGRERTHYVTKDWRQKPLGEVDPSGMLPSGEAFADVAELKTLLVEKTPLIRQNLVRKLLVQATGRIDDPADAADALKIASGESHDAGGADGPGLRTLILNVVASDAFRR